jgi:hypothetical protein
MGSEFKRSIKRGTGSVLSEHDRAEADIRTNIELGDLKSRHRNGLFRANRYNTFIEKAAIAAEAAIKAKNLTPEEVKTIVLQEMELLIRKGFVADAAAVKRAFESTTKDVWSVVIPREEGWPVIITNEEVQSVVIKATEVLFHELPENTPHPIKNMETVIAAWGIFGLSYINIKPTQTLNSIREKTLPFIRYGIKTNHEYLSSELATRLGMREEGIRERFEQAVCEETKEKLDNGSSVTISQMRNNFGTPRDRAAGIIIDHVLGLQRNGKISEASRKYLHSGSRPRDLKKDLEKRQGSLF